MNTSAINQFDAALSLFASLGVWPVWYRLQKMDARNPLEDKLHLMLSLLFCLLLVRAPYVGLNWDTPFAHLTYSFASLFALSVFLYFETLLRRHMPLLLKIFAALGTACFFTSSALGLVHGNKLNLMLFGTFLILLTLGAALTALFRRRSDYSLSENSLINLSVLALFFLLPFFLSDMAPYRAWYVPRMGVIGALIFAYVSLYNQAIFYEGWHLVGKFIRSFGFAILAWGVSIPLIGLDQWHVNLRMLVLFLVINFIFRIYFAIKHLDGEEDLYGFVKAVSEADKSSLTQFLKQIRKYFGKVDWKSVPFSDLQVYHCQKWQQLMFDRKVNHFSIFDLRRFIFNEDSLDVISAENQSLIEEMIHALETHDMTHICLLGSNFPVAIFFRIPMVGYDHMVSMQTKLVAEFVRLIDKVSDSRMS